MADRVENLLNLPDFLSRKMGSPQERRTINRTIAA